MKNREQHKIILMKNGEQLRITIMKNKAKWKTGIRDPEEANSAING